MRANVAGGRHGGVKRLYTVVLPMSPVDCEHTPRYPDWLQTFARRCQMLAGRLVDAPFDSVLADLRGLLSDVPPDLPEREILFVRTIAARSLFETMRRAGLEAHPSVTASITSWVVQKAPPTAAEWQDCAGGCARLTQLEAVTNLPPLR